MKKTVKISLLLLLALVQNLSSGSKCIAEPVDEQKGAPIDMGLESNRPRGVVNIPVCYYLNIGIVNIMAEGHITGINATVTRLEDNELWNGTSSGNVLSLLVSTDPGTYVLEVTLSDGMTFYGEYTL